MKDFSIHAKYIQPEFDDLCKRFSMGVEAGYRGARFTPTPSCEHVSQEDRDIVISRFVIGREVTSDEARDEIALKTDGRLRPVLYEELLCFAERYPDELRRQRTVSVGSDGYTHSLGWKEYFFWSLHEGPLLQLILPQVKLHNASVFLVTAR